MTSHLTLLILIGCSGGKVSSKDTVAADTAADTGQDSAPDNDSDSVEDSAPPVDTAEDSGEPVDTAPPPEPTVNTEEAGGVDDPAGWIFSSEEVIPIEIALSDDAKSALTADPYTYVSGNVTINGMEVDNVGVRLKGKIGSFRTLSGKAAFKIDFNAFVPDQSFYGLTKFNLNNNVVDCSYLKEHIVYKTYRDAGLPAERMGYAWVTVNGEAYGLYNILEQLDKPFLKNNFDDPNGNLYDGKYIWYGGYSYTLLDFLVSVQALYVLEEGTDVSNEDIGQVVAAIASSAGTSAYYDTVGAVVNWDQVLEYFAAEQWSGQNDGYALNTNNNFVYFDPTDGKMQMIPWDMDYSLLNDYDWGMNWSSPAGILAKTCMADTYFCKDAWKTRVGVFLDAVDEDAMLVQVADWTTLIKSYAEADPRRECSVGQVIDYQVYAQNWIKARRGYMTSFWGL